MKTVLTVAGSDSGGGAGIQADIKTMTMNGVYAMSVITALTAQNTLGVTAVEDVTADFLKKQLDAVFCDIFPDAVKTGMVSSKENVNAIAERLVYYGAKNIVTDPVMIATSGSKLIKDEAVSALIEKLLPVSILVTPNIPEAQVLAQMHIETQHDMLKAAKIINENSGCSVLIKGGHLKGDACDLLYENGRETWLCTKRIDNPNTHGTGCTLSSAIASNLAKGFLLEEAVKRAKEYISGALSAQLDLGRGSGPLNHMYALNCSFSEEGTE